MKTNLQFFLNSYGDLVPTTAPSMNNFKWLREINGISFNVENSQQIQVPASGSTVNILPASFMELEATATATTASSTAMTLSAANASIVPGLLVVGPGIPGDTTVASVSGTAVVLSKAATTSTTASFSFYLPASFVYLETDQQASVIYNGGSPIVLNPFQVNGVTQPAVFFIAGAATSLVANNLSSTTANIFFASMG